MCPLTPATHPCLPTAPPPLLPLCFAMPCRCYDKTDTAKAPPFTPYCRAYQADIVLAQHAVARQMAKAAAVIQPTYILNTGDNFYELGSNNTANFKETYENVYFNYKSLQNVVWLSVLGESSCAPD